MVGVIDTNEALQRAREAGLDLVEVAADSDPPVCRIMDFGKWKYEQSKKEKEKKAKSKHTELKEVRMGRSMKIDPHDIEIRLTQARRFLMEGHKVQIVQNFRGREMVHRDRGHDRMQQIIERLSDVGKLETPPRLNGRRMTMIVAPDRAKIERVKRQQASAKAADKGPAEDASEGSKREHETGGESEPVNRAEQTERAAAS
jgi:translation initiation factor IF-3